MASNGAECGRAIHRFDAGDEILVSERATPMEVQMVTEATDVSDNYAVVAENQHGRYRLVEQEDGSVAFYVSRSAWWGRCWDLETSDVEVSDVAE